MLYAFPMDDLTDDEREPLIAAARKALAEDPFPRAPLRSALAKLDPARKLRLCLSVLVGLSTAPAGIAGGQTTTNIFDGTYDGVSVSDSCGQPTPARQRPLVVTNGVAEWHAGPTGTIIFQGSVTPQGNLTMRSNLAVVFTGKIELNGKLTGGYAVAFDPCARSFVWQKK